MGLRQFCFRIVYLLGAGILCAPLLSWAQPSTPSAIELVTRAEKLYRGRFDSRGIYIDNQSARGKFISEQDRIISQIKARGYLSDSFRVYNNFLRDFFVDVSLVQHQGRFVALLVERSKYLNKVEEETLRLYSISDLRNGKTAFDFYGRPMVILSSPNLNSQKGGLVSVRFPKNLNEESSSEVRFLILRNTLGDLNFYSDRYVNFTRVDLLFNINIRERNFSVRSVNFR